MLCSVNLVSGLVLPGGSLHRAITQVSGAEENHSEVSEQITVMVELKQLLGTIK